MNILPKSVHPQFPAVGSRDVATQTDITAANHLGRQVKPATPRHLYPGCALGQSSNNAHDELSRKIKIIKTNALLINFTLLENAMAGKYDLYKCIAQEQQGKRFIAECAVATVINVKMPLDKSERVGLQSLDDCVFSLETLMAKGWNEEASEALKNNLVYELKRITIEGDNPSTEREQAIKLLIQQNQALFVDAEAAEKTFRAIQLFRRQLSYQQCFGVYPRTPKQVNLSYQQAIIDLEANRMFPGDEPLVQKKREYIHEKMTSALAQMTYPESRLISMIMDDMRAAGMLADGEKEILKKVLTSHYNNLPIPSSEVCLFYLQITLDFPDTLKSIGLDPKAMRSIINGCLIMHCLVKPNQESQQVEISWESLSQAWSRSVKVTAKLGSRQTRAIDEWFKECSQRLTYVPNTNVFRMLDSQIFSEKLGITPQYAPQYYRNNERADTIAKLRNLALKRPASTIDTALHASKMACLAKY
ncbi:hypothetical protein [Endozoicomonas sp. ONNA2]|uniref:hypothetical protein n=1 Tax=Endozoicomonas sp. ONNA2 TaxID=2828741 RepID=UPI00214776A0|nr:hypothetical protein [Endozoicomonas sp. ONNA2]